MVKISARDRCTTQGLIFAMRVLVSKEMCFTHTPIAMGWDPLKQVIVHVDKQFGRRDKTILFDLKTTSTKSGIRSIPE